MELKMFVVFGIMLAVASHAAGSCRDPIIRTNHFRIINENTGQEQHVLPLKGSNYNLAIKGSFHIGKVLESHSYSAKIDIGATMTGSLFGGFWQVHDWAVPKQYVGCPLPGNICEFTDMSCERGLEYLGLSNTLRCPVGTGNLDIQYSSIGKSPNINELVQKSDILHSVQKLVVRITVIFTDNQTNDQVLCFEKDVRFE